jgi:hypothetical protein
LPKQPFALGQLRGKAGNRLDVELVLHRIGSERNGVA